MPFDTHKLSLYVGAEREFEHKGRTYRVRVEHDDTPGKPWEEEYGHGPIEYHLRNSAGYVSKTPGEVVIASDRRGGWVYDFQATVKIAKRDGWDAEPYYPPGVETAGERAAKAAKADMQRMTDWLEGRWCYCGVTVELLCPHGGVVAYESLWGIESDAKDYLAEVVEELVDELSDVSDDCCDA